MSTRPIVIMHGWSDSSRSFHPLADRLTQRLGCPVHAIRLADYQSMNDAVTLDDLASAMDRAWRRARLPLEPRSVDLVVHSTGALVARHWMVSHFSPAEVPIHHLVMLAPANFGSPLAHKGRALLARAFYGLPVGGSFQVGAGLLRQLELASPFTWELAGRDRFGGDEYYGPGRVLCTVLVGDRGFDGLRAAANVEGGDGAVLASTANMECALLEVDLTGEPGRSQVRLAASRGATAFGLMPGENHSTITHSEAAVEWACRALTVGDEDFDAWRAELAARNAAIRSKDEPSQSLAGFQNTVCLAQDQHGRRIPDYFLDVSLDEEPEGGWLAELFQRDVIRSVHLNGEDSALRSMRVDCGTLHQRLDRPWEALRVRLTAHPRLAEGEPAGFRDGMSFLIPRPALADLFVPDRTLLVRLTLQREQAPELLRI